MNIKFEGKYKSIEKVIWNDIPKLSVITGKNGTGKSQLLDIINASIIKQWVNTPNSPNIYAEISGEVYRTEDLIFLRGEWALNNLGAIGLSNVQNDREQIYQQFTQRQETLKTLMKLILKIIKNIIVSKLHKLPFLIFLITLYMNVSYLMEGQYPKTIS